MTDDECRCGLPWPEHGGNDAIGPTKHWPAQLAAPVPPPPVALTARRKCERRLAAVIELAQRELRNGGLLDPADVLAAIGSSEVSS